MGFKELLLFRYTRRCAEAPADQAGHHFAQRGDVILGLIDVFLPLNAETRHIGAQSGKRFFIEESGQIVTAMGQQFAAAQTDEKCIEFTMSVARIDRVGQAGQGGDATTDRAVIAF